MEGNYGDWWSVGGSEADIHARRENNSEDFIYDPEAPLITLGDNQYCKSDTNFEIDESNWILVELICFQDKSLHIINGHVVMELVHSRQLVQNNTTLPLTKGSIQLQSEGAECFFKEIRIKKITKIPDQYIGYF